MKKAAFGALLFVSASLMARNYVYAPAMSVHKVEVIKYFPTLIPKPVLDHFNSMFYGAKAVSWQVVTDENSSTQYVAKFRLYSTKQTARFAPDGTYLGGGTY
jgi:hypothetical protein